MSAIFFFTIDFNNLLPTSTTTLVYIITIIILIFEYRRQNEIKSSRFIKKLKESNLELMPSPPKMPLIGHMYLMRDHPHNPWEGFNEIRKQYGNIVSIKMGIHPMILVSSFEAMKEVLLYKGDIFADRPNFYRHDVIFGGDKEHSLALCNWSNTHKARRKFCRQGVVPSDRSDRKLLLEKIISDNLAKFLDNIKSQRGNFTQNTTKQSFSRRITKKDILFLTGDVFMEFLCKESRSHHDENYDKFNWCCDYIFWDINQCYLIDFLPYLRAIGVSYHHLKELKQVTDYCRYYIDDNIFVPRRLKHQQLKSQNNDLDNLNDIDYLDSIIIEELKGKSLMSLEDYKVGFADLLAGHAAVANILLRVLGHLSLNPSYQELIYQEAKESNLLKLGHRPHLPVSEAALLEALRIASSPIVPHVARQDTSIGEYYVPKGSAVLFNCYHINLSEELWSKPDEYDPTRFLIKNGNSYTLNVPKYFTPFSTGLRQCLGLRMVESISIVAVASIVYTYRIGTNNEDLVRKLLKPKGSVALNPFEECYELRLFTRNNNSPTTTTTNN